jgi:hypothetical protein
MLFQFIIAKVVTTFMGGLRKDPDSGLEIIIRIHNTASTQIILQTVLLSSSPVVRIRDVLSRILEPDP